MNLEALSVNRLRRKSYSIAQMESRLSRQLRRTTSSGRKECPALTYDSAGPPYCSGNCITAAKMHGDRTKDYVPGVL